MISMRYHIMSIAAVFLALALGIFLGATKVQSPILVGNQDENAQLTAQRDALQQQNTDLSAQVASDQRLAGSVSQLAVRGTLPKATVVLISTQDADPGDRDAIVGLLGKAGAKVTSQLQLTQNFTDPGRSSELESLVAKSVPAGKGVLPDVASAGTMTGALLGSVLVTDPAGKTAASATDATTALSALSGAGYLTASGTQTPGRLVLVLTGGKQSGGSEADRAAAVADLATQLKKSAGGVVVVGRDGSATPQGVVGAVRGDGIRSQTVSTVDDANTTAGQLAAVLALVEQNGGGVGQYGTGTGAQGPVPALAVG